MGFDLRIPTTKDIPALAGSFQRAFADYHVPMTISEAGLKEFILQNDIDLDLSVMVMGGDGRILGQSFSGVRGDRAWVAGTGLEPGSRGKGVGMSMLEHQLKVLKDAGIQEVSLEVLDKNVDAKRVYQALGFKFRRDLFCFRHNEPKIGSLPPPAHLKFEGCEVEDVLGFYRPDNPWQCMKGSVEKMDGVKAFLSFLTKEGGPTRAEGLYKHGTDPHSDIYDSELPEIPDVEDPDLHLTPQGPELEGYCVYRETDKGTSVIDLYSVANARELLRHLIAVTKKRPVVTLNIFDGPSVMAYESLCFERFATQHELHLLF